MHIEKFNKTQSQMTLRHDLRLHNEYRNKNIDVNRKELNYDFNDGQNPFDLLKKRLGEVYIYGRNGKKADKIINLCSVCVTMPLDCPVSEKDFFRMIDEVLSDKFGIDNKISHIVHKDEGVTGVPGVPGVPLRIHSHYKFTPVIYNDKNAREELCCKKVMNRTMLQGFHADIEKRIYDKFGVKIKLHEPNPEERTKNHIKDIEEYKIARDIIRQSQEEVLELENGIRAREERIEELNQKGRNLVIKINETEEELQLLNETYNESLEDLKNIIKTNKILEEIQIDDELEI